MGFLVVLLLAIIGIWVWQFIETRNALATTSVVSRYPREQSAQLISNAFDGARTVLWTTASGPGDINMRRRGYKGGITMSIDIQPLPDGGSRVDMWASHYLGYLLLANFAGVVNRRKKAIGRMLTESVSQQGLSDGNDQASLPQSDPQSSRPLVNQDDPAQDDASWLSSAENRYKSSVSNHFGSPDTIAAGGDQSMRGRDPACALFFYQEAIDTLHSIYVCGFNDTGPGSWSRQPSEWDLSIIDRYFEALSSVRALRPGAPVEQSVMEVTHRMRAISTQFRSYGLDASSYLARLDQLARLAPDVDVAGVFWT